MQLDDRRYLLRYVRLTIGVQSTATEAGHYDDRDRISEKYKNYLAHLTEHKSYLIFLQSALTQFRPAPYYLYNPLITRSLAPSLNHDRVHRSPASVYNF